MVNSKQLAGLIGPTLIMLGATEAMNLAIFAANTPAVVYLNGTILFVAGLAIVRAHNHWSWNWSVLVTLTGWFAVVLGLYRMIAPAAPQAQAGPASSAMFAALFVLGAFLTYRSMVRDKRS